MKKCMICGGQTVASAKLCPPCRAALRRARDDTISELLPLPRRRDGIAYRDGTSVAGVFPFAGPDLAPPSRRSSRSRAALLRRVTPAHFRALALLSFIAAACVVGFVALHQLAALREQDASARQRASSPPAPESRPLETRVSPATLLGDARSELPPAPHDGVEDAPAEGAAIPAPAPPAERPARVRPASAKAAIVVDPLPAGGLVEPPVVIAAPAPVAAPVVAAPAPDRATMLANELGRCAGNFFSRTACESRARAQFCEGQWGQAAQCPAGIANEHGQ